MIPIDPITAELVASALIYASEEMGIAVRDAAYSPNIKERLDHSCALFDARGRMVAQAEHIPVHLGSLPWGLQRTLEYLRQAGVRFSADYVQRGLRSNPAITRLLVRLFESRFDPAKQDGAAERCLPPLFSPTAYVA